MGYPEIKLVHVSSVILSYGLFLLRGIWLMRDSAMLSKRWVKVLPHVVDTVLLASAIALTFLIHQYPVANNWLTVKVVGLVIYIRMGMIAFRHGSKRTRVLSWIAAQAVFANIVLVAVHHAAPFAPRLETFTGFPE